MAQIEENRLDGKTAVELPTAPSFGPQPQNNAGATAAPTGNNFQNFNSGKAPSLLSINNMLGSYSALSQEGTDYVKTIKDSLTEWAKSSQYPMKFDFIDLVNPVDTFVVMFGNKAIIMVFAESHPGSATQPTSHLDRAAVNELRKVRPEAELLKFLVIHKSDYSKANVMATCLRNTFINGSNMIEDMTRINLDSLTNANFSYSDSQEDFEAAYRQLSPHSVPLRHDFALTIYISDIQRRRNDFGLTEADRYYDESSGNGSRPICTISGYVEWVRISPDCYKFVPTIHISEIATHLSNEVLIPLWWTVFTNKVMMTDTWFNIYRSSIGPKKINLGNLVPYVNTNGDKNAPTRWILQNQQDFDRFRKDYCCTPVVVLDITQGRMSPVGIEKYTLTGKCANIMNEIVNNMARYSRVNLQFTQNDIIAPAAPYYRGVYQYGDKLYDTAYIDFLSEVSRTPANAIELETRLMQLPDYPHRTAQYLKEIHPDAQFLYRTDTVILPPSLTKTLTNQLSSMNFGGMQTMNNMFNIGVYNTASQQWGNIQNNSVYSPYNGFNPFSQFYG